MDLRKGLPNKEICSNVYVGDTKLQNKINGVFSCSPKVAGPSCLPNLPCFM